MTFFLKYIFGHFNSVHYTETKSRVLIDMNFQVEHGVITIADSFCLAKMFSEVFKKSDIH
jgi:hypothetical protein